MRNKIIHALLFAVCCVVYVALFFQAVGIIICGLYSLDMFLMAVQTYRNNHLLDFISVGCTCFVVTRLLDTWSRYDFMSKIGMIPDSDPRLILFCLIYTFLSFVLFGIYYTYYHKKYLS